MQTAALLAQARIAGDKLLRDLGPKPRDLGAALELQRAVSRELGWTQCGWKVGAASPTSQAIIGLDAPYPAPLFAERLFHSGDLVPTAPSNSRIAEPEIAFVMRSSLPLRRRAFAPGEVLAAVASVHPALEIVNPRLTRQLGEPAEWLVADGGTNDALVLGPASAAPAAGSYASIHVRAKLNGAWLTSGIGANVLGGPDRALTWLANALQRDGRTLRADDIVITGVLTDIIPCRPGDIVTADFGPLGCVHARF